MKDMDPYMQTGHSRSEMKPLLRQFSYAIKTQLKAPLSRKGTNPNYSYELYEFQYLLGIRRFVGTEMIKNLEFVGS